MFRFNTSFGSATNVYDTDISHDEYTRIVSRWLGLKRTPGKYDEDTKVYRAQQQAELEQWAQYNNPECAHVECTLRCMFYDGY